jgi:glutamate N-acetyltransferase/amino-acid N-acetyltransferase
MKRVKGGLCQAVIINSGNANACTGTQGLEDARTVSRGWQGTRIGEKLVLVSSTGVSVHSQQKR